MEQNTSVQPMDEPTEVQLTEVPMEVQPAESELTEERVREIVKQELKALKEEEAAKSPKRRPFGLSSHNKA